MTPEAQRIAIAEACPGILRQVDDSGNVVANGLWWEYLDGLFWRQCFNNDPLSDLNAMHEVEKVLTKERCVWFDKMLNDPTIHISGKCASKEYDWHATAAQRAEAFLRTLNLWKDDDGRVVGFEGDRRSYRNR